MTHETFDAGMALLMCQWPNHPASPDVYWHVLQGMDDQVFQRAIVACLESCKFFPVIAEIREKSEQILHAIGALPAEAGDAWGRLLALTARWDPDNGWCAPVRLDDDGKPVWGQVGEPNGYYGAPSPLDELTESAVRGVGGLKRIKYADLEQLGWIRKEFMAMYSSKREQHIRYGPSLPGVGRVQLGESAMASRA